MKLRTASLLLVLVSLGWQAAQAQRLRGRLLDLQTDAPIPDGILTLLTQDGARVATSVTDDSGAWVLVAPDSGTYLVEAKRLGYQPWIDGPVEIRRGDDWESIYRLSRLAVELDPVAVTAAATQRYLQLVGFYERQRSDFGHFIGREEIQRRQGSRLTDLLTTVPGVRLVPTGGGTGRLQVQMRGSSLSRGGGLCRPRVYVDGLIYHRGDSRPIGVDRWGNRVSAAESDEDWIQDFDIGLDAIAHPSSIAGIEVYRSGAQVPVKFGGTSVETLCGVIVIWTRVGEMKKKAGSR